MSFPASADSVVNCMPVTCMPSPESPAKRMTTVSRVSTGLRGLATPSDIGRDRGSASRRGEALNLYRGGTGVAMLASALTLSVVVPTLDEETTLAETLRAARQPGVAELIVVDGGSRDGTTTVACAFADRVLETARGRARQMNAGAAAADGDVLLFLHADTRLPDRYPAAVARAIFVRRDAFAGVGGYPLLPLMEDVALCRVLKRAGRMVALRETVLTSARRWQRHGVARTVFLMWGLRAAYYLGVSPARLARLYADAR